MDGSDVTLLVAFLAGVLSCSSPCVLPLVPVYLGHMVNVSTLTPGQRARTATVLHASVFVLGFSIVFVGFWTSLAFAGIALPENARLMRHVAGAVLVFMGLHLLGVIRVPFLERQYQLPSAPGGKPGYRRSLMLGVTFAAGWTPCIGPVLGSIIGLAMTDATVLNGALLLAAYSAGMGIPFIIMSFAASSISRWTRRQTVIRRAVPLLSGALVVTVGVLMLTNSLIRLNQFFDLTNVQV